MDNSWQWYTESSFTISSSYDLLHKMYDVAKRFVFRGQNPPVMTKEEKRAFNWNVARIRRICLWDYCFLFCCEIIMKKVIHVNQHKIKHNRNTGNRDPVLTVKTYKSNDYAHEVEILGPCKVVYRPDKPLSCGAVCWIETQDKVLVVVHKQCGDDILEIK